MQHFAKRYKQKSHIQSTIEQEKELIFKDIFGKEIEVALKGYIESLEADLIPVPEPSNVSNYSGQIRLRMPRILHHDLAVGATKQGMSLNTYMVYLLTNSRRSE